MTGRRRKGENAMPMCLAVAIWVAACVSADLVPALLIAAWIGWHLTD